MEAVPPHAVGDCNPIRGPRVERSGNSLSPEGDARDAFSSRASVRRSADQLSAMLNLVKSQCFVTLFVETVSTP